MKTLLNLSGGLYYHLRAVRYSRGLWKNYSNSVTLWLKNWQTQKSKLIVIGASGGYCVNFSSLPFEEMLVNEIDPLARYIFKKRYAGAKKVSFESRNFLSPENGKFRAEKLICWLESYPDYAILFSNVLGQLPALFAEEWKASGAEYLKNLFEYLKDRDWATFHDRVSLERGVARLPHNLEVFFQESLRPIKTPELCSHFSGGQKAATFIDHETDDFVSGPVRYFLWPLTPQKVHVIEGFQSSVLRRSV